MDCRKVFNLIFWRAKDHSNRRNPVEDTKEIINRHLRPAAMLLWSVVG
jgi:hypothetical protein